MFVTYRFWILSLWNAAPGGLVMPPRPEAADEQRIDDLIAQHLSHQKLEVLKQSELVRSRGFDICERSASLC